MATRVFHTATRSIFRALPRLAILVCMAAAGTSAAGLPTPEQQFQLALEAQSGKDYRGMLVHLRQAAEAGDPDAQEMLGMVLFVGPSLYGQAIKADMCEAAQWMRVAASRGSEAARQNVAMLNRMRSAMPVAKRC